MRVIDDPMKRSFLIRLTCLWLAATVLMGSSGYTVVEHVCQMRGKVSRVQLTPKGGCTKHCPVKPHSRSTKQPNVHKLPCCQLTTHYQHLETGQVATASPITFTQPAAVGDLIATSFFLLSALLLPSSDEPQPVESDAPLTASGRDRLVQFSTWLI